ncbi:DNA binding protein [Stutzerimonas urumqiensis]|uniref:histone-like nucleoid-structuring protein, MvaT/MvaU family n=1 Tax=Stutzerimonas urumqiensis TaxID=638269 RepID=UPI003BA9273C
MSRLAEFRALEQKLAAQLAELETLKNDKTLQREIEFEQKLKELMGQYDKAPRDVLSILVPDRSQAKPADAQPERARRKARAVKRYKHPKTGEVVETKGGNHKVLKAWKAEFGANEVESWLI